MQDFAAHVDGDLAGKVAAGYGGGDFGNVANLPGQVAGHGVDGIGEVFPGAGNAGDLGLAAQLSVGADFAGHAGYFRGEDAELLNHGVDDRRGTEEFAFQRTAVDVQAHRLGQVTLGDGGDGAGDFRGGAQQVLDQRIHRNFHLAPSAFGMVEPGALARPALLADHLPDALQFLRHLLIGGDNFIERIGDLAGQAGPGAREANGEVAIAHGLKTGENEAQVRGRQLTIDVPVALHVFGRWPCLQRLYHLDCFSSSRLSSFVSSDWPQNCLCKN